MEHPPQNDSDKDILTPQQLEIAMALVERYRPHLTGSESTEDIVALDESEAALKKYIEHMYGVTIESPKDFYLFMVGVEAALHRFTLFTADMGDLQKASKIKSQFALLAPDELLPNRSSSVEDE